MRPEARNRRRDRLFVVVAVIAMVLTGGAVGHRVAVAQPPAPPAVEVQVASGERVTVGFAGDTHVGDGSTAILEVEGWGATMANVAPLMKAHDVFVVNAEGPITASQNDARPGAKYSYGADPRAAEAMRSSGVTVAALANNHVMDRGHLGLADTLAHLEAAGVTAFGAGLTYEDAARPLILRTDAGTIGIVNLGENFGPLSRADDESGGMVMMTYNTVQRGVDAARAQGADYVVAFVHWGNNYAPVTDLQRYWAGQMVAAGYDAVIGAGSHTIQPFELVGGTPVLYGLGNFVFGSRGRFAQFGVEGLGLIATLDWSEEAGARIGVQCVQVDNLKVDYRPRPCDEALRAEAFEVVSPDLVVEGEVGWLPLG